MNADEKYRISTYKEKIVLSESPSKRICIAINEVTNKLYVKKVLPGTDYFNLYARLASLRHRNLVTVHDVICYDGATYVIEEYTNGQTLHALLENEGPQTESKAADYIMQVCDALIYLHSQNPPIIHRDIKPENIILSTDNVIKLVDFDIAREFKQSAKRDTMFMGTKEYAAPEQYGYKQTDGRTDVYAIGVLLHEMLTGKLPQNNVAYTGALRKIILKCLRLEPAQRYRSVSALKKALAGTRYIRHKKTGLLALSVVVAIVTMIACFSKITNYLYNPVHTASFSSPPSKPDDMITITSENGIFTAQIPPDWKEDNTINESADLQASKARSSSYLVLLAENKKDFDSFQEWKSAVFSAFVEYVENAVISDETEITVNGRPAIQQTLSGVYESTRVKVLLIYIDGADYYGQIICGSTASEYDSSLSAFETIIGSIRGL